MLQAGCSALISHVHFSYRPWTAQSCVQPEVSPASTASYRSQVVALEHSHSGIFHWSSMLTTVRATANWHHHSIVPGGLLPTGAYVTPIFPPISLPQLRLLSLATDMKLDTRSTASYSSPPF